MSDQEDSPISDEEEPNLEKQLKTALARKVSHKENTLRLSEEEYHFLKEEPVISSDTPRAMADIYQDAKKLTEEIQNHRETQKIISLTTQQQTHLTSLEEELEEKVNAISSGMYTATQSVLEQIDTTKKILSYMKR